MRLLHLIKKEFIELFRQKELLPLLLIAPVIQIVVLGYVVTTDINHVPVEVINLSHRPAAARIVNRLQQTPQFTLKKVHSQWTDGREILRKGDAVAVILMRDSVTENKSSPYPEIQVMMDGVDSNTSAIAAGYLNGILKRYIDGNMKRSNSNFPLSQQALIRFNPDLRSINYMGPGIVALLLTILTLFITSVSLVREKEQQTMDTLLISNLRSWEIYIGKAAPMAVIGLLEMGLGIVVVMTWFRIPVRGQLLLLIPAALVFLTAILSYALLISIVASTQQQALFFSWFSMVTFILLSGLFTPVENIPPGLMVLADINPLRYLIKIIREVFLKGNGMKYFYWDLLKLLGITGVVTTASLAVFKRFVSR